MEGAHSVQVFVVGIIAAALLCFAILTAAHKILSPLVKLLVLSDSTYPNGVYLV